MRNDTRSRSPRGALAAMYVGLLLTLAATVTPYVDRATGQVLADHIREGYPTYSADRIDSAVTTWLVLLSVTGVLGIVAWLVAIRAVRRRQAWARWGATAMFVVGTCLALTALLTRDTSGEVGLAPLLGWIGMLPSAAGLAALALLWRRA